MTTQPVTDGTSTEDLAARMARVADVHRRLKEAIHLRIVGQEPVVESVLLAVLSRGHVLLEGVPGLGKTMLVRTLSEALDLAFKRIQFTPDLMPADVVGTNVLVEGEDGRRSFEFRRGPVFASLVLADEINRATPKTQSALLEAMQEASVTVAAVSHALPDPFFVLATQNPLEMEGTYPLPEAQLDRFLFKVKVPFPSEDELSRILNLTTTAGSPRVEAVATGRDLVDAQRLVREIPIASTVQAFVVRMVLATHPENPGAPEQTRRYVRYGSSPRGAQALILAAKARALVAGRPNVSFEDVRAVAPEALRHRVILNFEGQASGLDPDAIVRQVVETTPEEARA